VTAPRVTATAPPVTELTYTAVRLADDLDPLAVYATSTARTRSYWSGRGSDLTFAAIGVVADLATTGATPDAFRSIARARLALGSRLSRHPGSPPGPDVLLVGGFAFDQPPAGADPRWAGFPSGRLVLPEILVVREDRGEVWAVVAGPAGSEGAGLETLQGTVDAAASWRPCPPPAGPAVDDADLDDPAYAALVADGLDRIAAGGLEKVVLARAVDLPLAVDPPVLAGRLRIRFPTCAVFAFTEGATTFLGASPELLVRIVGGAVETEALAGSRPRHPDPAVDAALGQELFDEPKEVAEHRFVVEELRRALVAAGATLGGGADPVLRVLPGIQHLFTPVRGRMASTATTALALAQRLHPSPAVGGTPNAAARAFIRDHERFDRGWYAAPVGWVDLDGDGELHVALRSGLAHPGGLRLFAGAGIVAGSDPERELAETTNKLHAVLDAWTGG
jgi:isochorismate synthase